MHSLRKNEKKNHLSGKYLPLKKKLPLSSFTDSTGIYVFYMHSE